MAFRWWLTATTNQTQKRVITIQRRWLITPQKKPSLSSQPQLLFPFRRWNVKNFTGFWKIYFTLCKNIKYICVCCCCCCFCFKNLFRFIDRNEYLCLKVGCCCEDVNKLEKGWRECIFGILRWNNHSNSKRIFVLLDCEWLSY